MFKSKSIKNKGLLLIIIYLLMFMNVSFVNAQWLAGWNYRKSHTITGSGDGAQTNYQVGIKVYYGDGVDGTEVVTGITFGKVYLDSKCETDFGDIRFTEDDGETELDYWIESYVDSSYAIIWVKISSILADPNTVDIYIYYGKGAESTTSDGVATFPKLFDHFLGPSLDLSIWTVHSAGGSVSFTGSVIRVQGNAGSNKYAFASKSPYEDSDPMALRFLALLEVTTGSSQITQIGFTRWGQTAQANIKSYHGTHETQTIDSLGNQLRHTIGAGYFGSYKTYEIVRDGTNAKYRVDGVMASIRSLAPDTETTGAQFYCRDSERDIYCDWILIREYTWNEPTHTSWGGEESLNENPTITSTLLSDPDDGDNCYEMESYYIFVTVVNDLDGADTIAKVYHQIKQGGAVIAEIRATTLDGVPSYDIQTGATVIDIDVGSCSWAENGNEGTLTLLIRFEWDFIDQADLEIFIYVEDTSAGSAGFTEMQTNYFDVIGRLVIYNYAVDDDRINIGSSSLHSGEVFYADTVGGDNPSVIYPLDAQFTAIHIHNSTHNSQGNDNSIINGVFSGISVTVPNIVQSNTYHVYLDLVADYSDADAPDGDTVAVIGDRIIILTLTADVTLLEVGEYAQLRLTAELEYDHHALGAGDFIEINSTVLTWDAGDSRFEVYVTSAVVGNFTYNLYTDGLEATFVITIGNIDGKSVKIEFILYPPSDPNLLFGAGFNATSPYVELHWNHTTIKVSIFEVQNSSDGISWDYLGVSTTTNYTDNQVINGTYRYYRVRACNYTDPNWSNSSYSNINLEKVYFVSEIGSGLLSEDYAGLLIVGLILGLVIGIGASRS